MFLRFLFAAVVLGSATTDRGRAQKNPNRIPAPPAGVLTKADERAVRRHPKPLPETPWTERAGLLEGADELGPLVPGKFALLVQDGNAYYAPLDGLKAPPRPSAVFGFAETKRALVAAEMQFLERGMSASAMTPQPYDGALIVLSEGTSVPATYIRVSGGEIFYLKPGDEQNKLLIPPIRAADLQTRSLDVSKVRQIYWPPETESGGFPGLSTQTLAVSAGGKEFHHHFLIAEWVAPTPASKIPVEVNFISLANPEQELDRFKRVPYAKGLLWSIGPDGATAMTLDKKILGRMTEQAALGKEVFSAACPGYIRVIATREGSEFVYDPKLAAFVHAARSAMPLSRVGLKRLPAERVKIYNELSSRLLVPKSYRPLPWANVGADDRVDFLNGYRNAEFPADVPISPIQSRALKPEEKWNHVVNLTVADQLALGGKFLFYRDFVAKLAVAKGGRAFEWTDLSQDEQLIVHRYCEQQRRREEAAAARGEKFGKIVVASLTLGAMAWGAADDHDKKIREEAKTHSYKIGDQVRSFMPPLLGGWTGHVHALGRDSDEFEIKIDSAPHPTSSFKDSVGKESIRMRRGIDFRPN